MQKEEKKCKECGHLLPMNYFDDEGDYCYTCQEHYFMYLRNENGGI